MTKVQTAAVKRDWAWEGCARPNRTNDARSGGREGAGRWKRGKRRGSLGEQKRRASARGGRCGQGGVDRHTERDGGRSARDCGNPKQGIEVMMRSVVRRGVKRSGQEERLGWRGREWESERKNLRARLGMPARPCGWLSCGCLSVPPRRCSPACAPTSQPDHLGMASSGRPSANPSFLPTTLMSEPEQTNTHLAHSGSVAEGTSSTKHQSLSNSQMTFTHFLSGIPLPQKRLRRSRAWTWTQPAGFYDESKTCRRLS